jgi:type IV secretion system protein TrbE
MRIAIASPGGTFQGFDHTGLLDKPRVVPAVLSYILHRLEGCLDGSPTVLVCDDFAKYFAFPIFVDLLDGLLRLRRKDHLAVWFSTPKRRGSARHLAGQAGLG